MLHDSTIIIDILQTKFNLPLTVYALLLYIEKPEQYVSYSLSLHIYSSRNLFNVFKDRYQSETSRKTLWKLNKERVVNQRSPVSMKRALNN